MPHKRAKRSVREKERAEKGHDLAPTKNHLKVSSDDAIPKSAARVLNAMKIREDYRKRKLQAEDDGEERPGKRRKSKNANTGVEKQEGKKEENSVGKILPGESLGHYNKRVEASMRPLVRTAVKTSLAVVRGASKSETKNKTKPAKKDEDDDEEVAPVARDKHASKPKEFAKLSTSAPKRLNDIVQAPPEMPRLRGAEKLLGTAGNSGNFKGKGVISMAQKQMMEEEREKAIQRYRDMKAKAREGRS